MRKLLFLAALIVTCQAMARAQDSQSQSPPGLSATFTGQVNYADGRPAAGARVEAFPAGRRWSGSAPWAESDAAGRFSIKTQTPGAYRFYASKEEEYYPITFSAFHEVDGVRAPEATAAGGDVTEVGAVILNSQAGRLVTVIVDAATGLPVRNAWVEFRREDRGGVMMTAGAGRSGGKAVALVPVVPLRLTVKATGYLDKQYDGDGAEGQSSALQIEAGQTKEIRVALRSSGG